MRQQSENMGSFAHNGRNYPRLQFWQIDDAYFENPEIINSSVADGVADSSESEVGSAF